MKHMNYSGRIAYMTEKDGRPFERGREWFSVTIHEDGQRTLRTQSEMDDRGTLRDVTYTVDSQIRPLDCFIRLHKHGRFLGSGWCLFQEDQAECEVWNRELGRIRQVVSLKRRIRSFGSHALIADAMLSMNFDHDRPESIQPVRDLFLSSLEHDGSSGPLILPVDFKIEYLGRENVQTRVGRFEADHYQYLVEGALPIEHPTEEVWVVPGTGHPIKAYVGGYLQTTYELVELKGEIL